MNSVSSATLLTHLRSEADRWLCRLGTVFSSPKPHRQFLKLFAFALGLMVGVFLLTEGRTLRSARHADRLEYEREASVFLSTQNAAMDRLIGFVETLAWLLSESDRRPPGPADRSATPAIPEGWMVLEIFRPDRRTPRILRPTGLAEGEQQRLLSTPEVESALKGALATNSAVCSPLFRVPDSAGRLIPVVAVACRMGAGNQSHGVLVAIVDPGGLIETSLAATGDRRFTYQIQNEPPNGVVLQSPNWSVPATDRGLARWMAQRLSFKAEDDSYVRRESGHFRGWNLGVELRAAPSFLEGSAGTGRTQNNPWLLILLRALMLTVVATILRRMMVRTNDLKAAQESISRLSLHRSMVQQELHDHIIQSLTILSLRISMADTKTLDQFEDQKKSILTQLDYLRGELRRLLFDNLADLNSSQEAVKRIQAIAGQFQLSMGVACRVDSTGDGNSHFSAEMLFRTTRFAEELIGNAARHGRAKQINVKIHFSANGHIVLRVSDNGIGFDPSSAKAGFGLRNASSYAKRTGGGLRIQANPPHGTVVELEYSEIRV